MAPEYGQKNETNQQALAHIGLIVAVALVVALAVVGLRTIGGADGAGAAAASAPTVSSANAELGTAGEGADESSSEDSVAAHSSDVGSECSVIAGLRPADGDGDGSIESCWPVQGAGERPEQCPSIGDYVFADANNDDIVDRCVRPDPLCPDVGDSDRSGRRTRQRDSEDEADEADIGFEIDTDLDGEADSCLRCPVGGPVQLVDTDDDGVIDSCQSSEGILRLRRPTPEAVVAPPTPMATPVPNRRAPTPRPGATATVRPRPTSTTVPYSSRPNR